jgi:hypothetical protein
MPAWVFCLGFSQIIARRQKSRKPLQLTMPTQSHPLFGDILHELLSPVDVIVEQDQRVMVGPPRIDVILIRPRGEVWTDEQRARLPDGIRDVSAPRVLIELKYTQSLNCDACTKTLSYDLFYRESKNLNPNAVASFLVSAMTTREPMLARLNYQAVTPGVYQSTDPQRARVGIILLNELPATTHNAAFKCFASRREAYLRGLEQLSGSPWARRSRRLMEFLLNLWRLLMIEEPVFEPMLPEDIERMGQIFFDGLLETTPVDEILKHFTADAVLKHYTPDEVLKHYPSDEVLKHYPSDEVLKHYSLDEMLAHFSIEDVQEALKKKQDLLH